MNTSQTVLEAALGSSSSAPTSTDNSPGGLWRDIRDFGAQPGLANAAATRAAIQAAIDSLSPALNPSRGQGAWGTVHIPASDPYWYIDAPIWFDQDSVVIQGDGPLSVIALSPSREDSCFLVGIPRNAYGQTMTSDHWIDLHGMLDATAASEPGQRWGLRTRTDSQVAQNAGPLSYAHDYWRGVQRLTIEFVTDYGLTPFRPNPIFGMQAGGKPSPWFLLGAIGPEGDTYTLLFRTTDGQIRAFNVTAPTSPTIHRIVLQLDLVTLTATAYIDGVQVAISPSLGTGSNLKFFPNENIPFKIGSTGRLANMYGSDYYGYVLPLDLTLYGLRISNVIRYADDGVGQPQRRIDGQPINDFKAYFEAETHTLALLPLQDDPARAADRFVTVVGSHGGVGRSSMALFLSSKHADPFTSTKHNEFRNLQILGTQAGRGEGITMGYALYTRVENARVVGGAHGIGTWCWGANYVTKLRNCSLSGADAGIYNYYGIMEAQDITFEQHSRSTIWLEASVFRGRGLFTPYNFEGVEHVVRGLNGTKATIENLDVDFEGGGPEVSAFLAESSIAAGEPIGGQLILKGINVGTIRDGTPFVKLHQGGPTDPPSIFLLENVLLHGQDYKGLVETDGPAWAGEVRSELTGEFPAVVHSGAGTTGVVAQNHRYTGPPRITGWTRGGHVLTVPGPVAGQFTEWRCVETGTYGTDTPPEWAGLRPLDVHAGALGAYVLGQTYWTKGAGTRYGFYTDWAQAVVLNRLFGGADWSPPATAYVGLSSFQAFRSGGVVEPSGGGYARVASTWTAAVGGASSNATTVTFPTPMTDWGQVRTLFLADALTGGNVLAMIEIEPIAVNSGTGVSFAAGSLTVAESARPRGFADVTCNAINDAWLRGAALAVPTIHLALSTSVANPATTPVEPVGGGYARVAAGVVAWSTAISNGFPYENDIVTSATSLAFPLPTASWGTVRSLYLMDAATGGGVIAATNLTVPRTPDTGSGAPTFAAGALWITRS